MSIGEQVGAQGRSRSCVSSGRAAYMRRGFFVPHEDATHLPGTTLAAPSIASAFAPRRLQTLDFVTCMRHAELGNWPRERARVRQPSNSLTWDHFSLRATAERRIRRFVSFTAGGSHNRASRLHPPRYFFSYSDSWFPSSETSPLVGARAPKVGVSSVRSVRGNVLGSHV